MDEPHRVTTCVGIDVSKDRLDVHLRPSGEAFAVARDSKGLETLVERLGTLDISLIVLEATGGFETTVAATLASAGLPLAVVNPRQIRNFAKALGKLAKTGLVGDYMRVRAFPFGDEVCEFLENHDQIFVVEQNRDAQLKTLLTLETPVPKEKLFSVLAWGGFPLQASQVVDGITAQLKGAS